MKRKHFIRKVVPAGIALTLAGLQPGAGIPGLIPEESPSQPPSLKTGDTIGICSPAGFILLEDIAPAIARLELWGFKVRVGMTVGKRDGSFGGTDKERAQDLQEMLDDPGVNAILLARGGYGLVRIIDQLHFKKFRKHPKWVIGFSDATVLHSHIHRHTGIATLHAKMCNSFPKDWLLADDVQKESIDRIYAALTGKFKPLEINAHPQNRQGVARAVLVGGNLKVIDSLLSSDSDIETKNKILFLEDTGEYLYSLDRMFWTLKRAGKLEHLAGLIIGGFRIKPDDPGEEFGMGLEQIILEKVSEYKYPVCFQFPVGHQKNNFPLLCGVAHELRVSGDGVTLSMI